ncbi:MAG: beta-galactosidase, partial [Spirochaetia bacterium]
MNDYTLDARIDASPITPALPELGGVNPRGDRIAFTNAFMTWNGRPWLAVAGELHYARVMRSAWRSELLKMKAGGVDIVSTYVFWIHHEEDEGVFDWVGDRDLRRFIQECAGAGIHAIVRVGPFCHGEVRNGGMPDWLYGRPFPLRSNDERYLFFVRRLYREIGRQLHGLFFKDGGPIIGIQLENELMHAGAPWETVPRLAQEWVTAGTGGADHLRTLKSIALESGLDAPIHTSTAWGGAPVLEGEVLPLYGGYAFCPWNVTEKTPGHAPTREYIFRNYRRPVRRDPLFDPSYDPSAIPFACCEMGGGMQAWYRYRFMVPAESVEAMAVVKLAGGCSMLGYYMYHGGTNPPGKHGFLNEHVVPRVSYDFQAPIGEFGQVRESFRRLRRLHLMYRSFAGEIAPTEPVMPAGAEEIDPKDTQTLRFAARVRGDSGFLFLNNFQDHAATRDQADVHVSVELPGGLVRFPDSGTFTLQANDCAVLPFNLDLGGVRLMSATVQPLGRLVVDDILHYFFFSHSGVPPEYCLAGADLESSEGRERVILRPSPGIADAVDLRSRPGRHIVLHTLTPEESL